MPSPPFRKSRKIQVWEAFEVFVLAKNLCVQSHDDEPHELRAEFHEGSWQSDFSATWRGASRGENAVELYKTR